MIWVLLRAEFEALALGAAPGVDEAQIACAEAELAQHAGPAQLRGLWWRRSAPDGFIDKALSHGASTFFAVHGYGSRKHLH